MEREEDPFFPWAEEGRNPSLQGWLHRQRMCCSFSTSKSTPESKWKINGEICLVLHVQLPPCAGVGQSESSWGYREYKAAGDTWGSVGGCSDPHDLLWRGRSGAGREGEDPIPCPAGSHPA